MTRPKKIAIVVLIGIAALMGGLSSFTGVAAVDSVSSVGQVFYWYVLPPLPFLILVALIQSIQNINVYGLIGAAVGAAIAVVAPYSLLVIDSMNYSGGGANIGLALLLIAMPIYIPISMVFGYVVGRCISLLRAKKEIGSGCKN